MENHEYFILARTLHIVGIVLWIGGVAFVTTILIPSLIKITNSEDRLALFEQLEGRFALQARFTTLLTGITGYYMVDVMNAWERYLQLQYWWMHLMTLIWLIFTLVLFIFEPLFLHQWFRNLALSESDRAFNRLHTMHKILLSLSLIAVMGALSGAHGFQFV